AIPLFSLFGEVMAGAVNPQGISGTGWLVLVLIYAVFGFGATLALAVFNVSLHAEARDQRLPIHRSFAAMRGNLLRAAGLLFALMILFYVIFSVILFVGGLALIGSSGVLSLVGIVLSFAIGNAWNFLAAAYGAFFAVRVVPELKV
ncbi:MAG TPA: hypothetical protein VD713_01085, partial [Sphingomonadales bacterium]|nr:hypothetical protein [Sphingomonadales bacterium]